MSNWIPVQHGVRASKMGIWRDAPHGKAFLWLRQHVAYTADNCLPWPFAKDLRIGRGKVNYRGHNYWAHRLMCEMAHGAPPTPKHQAAHTCGKGHYGCVNPRHLAWKTNSENQLDRAVNGNVLRNPNGPKGHLTQAQIDEIVSLKGKMTQTKIAAKLGVSLGCVQYWLKYRKDRGHDEVKQILWSQAEDDAIRAGAAKGMSFTQIAAIIPGRSAGSISNRAYRIGLKSGRRPPPSRIYTRKSECITRASQ